jgi:hypothetical protein
MDGFSIGNPGWYRSTISHQSSHAAVLVAVDLHTGTLVSLTLIPASCAFKTTTSVCSEYGADSRSLNVNCKG